MDEFLKEAVDLLKTFGLPTVLLLILLYGIYRTIRYASTRFLEPFFDKVVNQVHDFLLDLKRTLDRAESHLTRQVNSVQELAQHNSSIIDRNKEILNQNQEIILLVRKVSDKVDSINLKVEQVVVHAEGPAVIMSAKKEKDTSA